MRCQRFALFGFIVAAAITSVYLISMSPPNPGPIDQAAVKHIQILCGKLTDCEVTLHDIFPGDWDTFHKFGYDVKEDELSRLLHTRSVRVSDLQDINVFTKKGFEKVMAARVRPTLGNEIEFSGFVDKDLGIPAYHPSDRFKVKACPTLEGGRCSVHAAAHPIF